MFTIKRISKVPNSPIRVAVDQPDPDGTDGGFQQGGVFNFAPKGQDGDTHQVSEHAAKAIMWDPTLADHFECTPHLPRTKREDREEVVIPPGTPVHPADAQPDGDLQQEHANGTRTNERKAGGGKGAAGRKTH